jgi:hypothetical protein
MSDERARFLNHKRLLIGLNSDERLELDSLALIVGGGVNADGSPAGLMMIRKSPEYIAARAALMDDHGNITPADELAAWAASGQIERQESIVDAPIVMQDQDATDAGEQGPVAPVAIQEQPAPVAEALMEKDARGNPIKAKSRPWIRPANDADFIQGEA